MFKTGFYGGKFMPFHRGHLDCCIRAASMCEELYVAVMYNGPEELQIAQQEITFDQRFLTPHIRTKAISEELAFLGNVTVFSYDCQPADERAAVEGLHPWHYECQDMVAIMGRFDAAFSSEPEYAENFKLMYPWAQPVLLDTGRTRNPVSGTALRNMATMKAYDYLPRAYQQKLNRKVLITGTESCGKTTLAQKLAALYGAEFVPEAGREFCELCRMSSPGIEDYPAILARQKSAEYAAVQRANKLVFCDTDSIVTEFYARLYEDGELPMAAGMRDPGQWDLVLYLEPTVPWVDDGLRTESADSRRWENDRVLRAMYEDAGYRLHVLSGDYLQNFDSAVALVDEMMGR